MSQSQWCRGGGGGGGSRRGKSRRRSSSRRRRPGGSPSGSCRSSRSLELASRFELQSQLTSRFESQLPWLSTCWSQSASGSRRDSRGLSCGCSPSCGCGSRGGRAAGVEVAVGVAVRVGVRVGVGVGLLLFLLCRARHFDFRRRRALGRVAGDRDLRRKIRSGVGGRKFNRDGGFSVRLNQCRALARQYMEEFDFRLAARRSPTERRRHCL